MSVSCSLDHAVAVTEQGSVLAWGSPTLLPSAEGLGAGAVARGAALPGLQMRELISSAACCSGGTVLLCSPTRFTLSMHLMGKALRSVCEWYTEQASRQGIYLIGGGVLTAPLLSSTPGSHSFGCPHGCCRAGSLLLTTVLLTTAQVMDRMERTAQAREQAAAVQVLKPEPALGTIAESDVRPAATVCVCGFLVLSRVGKCRKKRRTRTRTTSRRSRRQGILAGSSRRL